MTAKLYEKLADYSKNGRYPFHMPGHKMGRGLEINDIFALDITEIEGFDNLHKPDGIIKEAQEDYARFFGAERSFFCVNGSTGALQAAIMSVCMPGDKIIMARNCHRSVYSSLILTGAVPVFVMPEYCGKSGIPAGISPEALKRAVCANRDARAVIITSPTAEGIVSDIEEIARTAHDNNMVLIVDEAHGAHFGLSECFPDTAIGMGADIAVHSAHKTLNCPTQTAVLHAGGTRVDCERIQEVLSVIETSSPSYVFMALLDRCRDLLENYGQKVYADFTEFVLNERKKLAGLKNMYLLDTDLCGKYGIKALDISKIVIVSQNISGVYVSDILRNEYNIELEMGCAGHFMAITSPSDDRKQIKRLINAVIEIDSSAIINGTAENRITPRLLNLRQAVTPREAFYSKAEDIDFWKAEGRVCAEFIIPYPPGIPLVSPGEEITEEMLEYISFIVKNGVEITGVKSKALEKLRVLS